MTLYNVIKILPVILVIILIKFVSTLDITNAVQLAVTPPHEQRILNFTELAHKYGQKCVEYEVTTEDGYILKIFNILGDDTKPVIFLNGFVDTSVSYIIRGNRSMGISFAKLNYSLWFGNFRGTMYSRKHVTLNPDRDRKFWDFSFHEMGHYDLPAFIDFVLEKTGQTKVQIISHSLGTTCTYVLGSTRPEYNSKVSISVSLAPIAHMQHVKVPASLIIDAGPALNLLFLTTGQEEFFGDNTFATTVFRTACANTSISDECGELLEIVLSGYDEDANVGDLFSVAFLYYPTGSSRKTINHIFQISINDRFAQYDYGFIRNLFVYKWMWPPIYDLNKASMKFALFVAQNDELSTVPDAEWLRDQLPNVAYYKVLDRKQMNHMDFLWGANADQYLFPYIFDVLEKNK